MKPRLWLLLLHLARLGAINRAVRTSGLEIAEKTGTSQQTASRALIELANKGMIERKVTPRGCVVMLTAKGVEELKGVYSVLRSIFEPVERFLVIEGRVFDGLGEGKWYVSQSGYRSQFIEKLGFDPFPGTLNLRLDPVNKILRKRLESYPSVVIRGFTTAERSFGYVKCYRAIINDAVEGAAVIIERGHHDSSVLELIAPVCLKRELGLEEGDRVRVKVILRD